MYKIFIPQLPVLLARLLVNSRLSVAKFLGSPTLYVDFLMQRGLVSLTPALFKGLLYLFPSGGNMSAFYRLSVFCGNRVWADTLFLL